MSVCKMCGDKTEQEFTTPDGEAHYVCGHCSDEYDDEDIIAFFAGTLLIEDFGLFG